RSRLSHAVGRLERTGLVTREECTTDRRGTFAVLTRRGRAALERAAPGHVATVRELVFDRLKPSDVAHLERIARVIGEPPERAEPSDPPDGPTRRRGASGRRA